MLERLGEITVTAGDWLLGWLLYLPSDLALFLVAAGTAALLVLVRKWTTNQDLLHRVAADKRQLKLLLREAKQRKDSAALARYRATWSLVALQQLGAEGRPLLVSLLPIAFLATWCAMRIAFHPPRAEQPVELVLHAPVSVAGEVAHLVPADGLTSAAWIERLATADANHGAPAGATAHWHLRATGAAAPYRLRFRLGEQTFEHELLVGQSRYANPWQLHDDAGTWATEARLQPVKLLGIVPGIDATASPWLSRVPVLRYLVLPPWMVAYLLITLPVTFFLKWLWRVA